jgi:maltooligosyltrehalose synthase
LNDFRNFVDKIALYGACNAYSQVLLKMTSPGIPDFVQAQNSGNLHSPTRATGVMWILVSA